MRLLILGLVVYLIYRVVKSLILTEPGPSPRVDASPRQHIDDVMVKDPFCGIYFPMREGVEAKVDGKTLHFCSADCRDRYLAGHPGGS